MSDSDYIVIGDFDSSSTCMLWLHGYGANNWSFEPTIKLIETKLDGKLSAILPNAPMINGKRSWFPLPYKTDSDKLNEDCEGLIHAIDNIYIFINKFKNKIDSKKFLIGGFSQGAALTLAIMCDARAKIDGYISISGYMPCRNIFNKKMLNEEKLFIAHGEKDDVINIAAHIETVEFLKNIGVKPIENIGSYGHTIPNVVIDQVANWLLKNYL